MTTIKHLLATAALVSSTAVAASAATIFEETFSDTGALSGSTPDLTTGAATWTASEWQENGSTAAIATTGTADTLENRSNDDSAFLAFTPTAGKIYTLSATMTVPTGGLTNGWVGLGFTSTNNTTSEFWANDAAAWFLYRPSTNVDTFLGPETGGSADEGNHAVSADFDIVLNTEEAAWTAEWFINGGSVRTATFGTNPTINHVGFGRENGNTSAIDNFTLSDNTVIPEPSALLLGGLGLLAMLRRRRN